MILKLMQFILILLLTGKLQATGGGGTKECMSKENTDSVGQHWQTKSR